MAMSVPVIIITKRYLQIQRLAFLCHFKRKKQKNLKRDHHYHGPIMVISLLSLCATRRRSQPNIQTISPAPAQHAAHFVNRRLLTQTYAVIKFYYYTRYRPRRPHRTSAVLYMAVRLRWPSLHRIYLPSTRGRWYTTSTRCAIESA